MKVSKGKELKNYENAIDNYKKVIEGDSNYSESQSKIEVLIPTIAQEYYDKAKDEYDKEDYSSALSDINSAIKYVDNSEYQDMKQKCVEANNKAIADKAEAERQRKLLAPGKDLISNILEQILHQKFYQKKHLEHIVIIIVRMILYI